MDTVKKLNEQIMAITTKIRNCYPELSKYLDEMPVSIPDESNPEITTKTLRSYLETLQSLIDKYKPGHPAAVMCE